MQPSTWKRYLLVLVFVVSLNVPARASAALAVPCSASALVSSISAANASAGDDTLSLQAGCVYLLSASDNGANGLPVIADRAAAGRLTINGNGATILRGVRVWIPLVARDGAGGLGHSLIRDPLIRDSLIRDSEHLIPNQRINELPNQRITNQRINELPDYRIPNQRITKSPLPPLSSSPALSDFRILRVAAGGELALNDLTLENGFLADGNGGAVSNSGTLALNNVTVRGNGAVMGGGIYNLGTLAVTGSTITGNSAATIGGGISSGGALRVSDSTFRQNSAVLGDGILVAEGSSLLSSSSFSGDSLFTCPAFPYTAGAGDSAGLVTAVHCANGGQSNSVITLTKSTYTLSAADNDSFGRGPSGLPVVWDAAEAGALAVNGNDATIARSGAAGTPEFRIWAVHPGGNLALNRLTVENGSLTGFAGGGIYAESGTLALNQAAVNFSHAEFGGGIAANFSTVTLAGSALNYNTTTRDGAALNMNGALTVTGSQVVGNSAEGLGGGILVGEGTHAISSTTFTQNRSSAPASGAALLAISLDGSLATTLAVAGCTFSFNNGTGAGGALFTTPGTTTTITNSTFSGNSAGWGVIVNNGTLTIAHSTISANQSIHTSGAIAANQGTVYLRSSIVAGNTTTHDSPDIQGTLVSQGYNVIGSLAGTTLTGDLTGNKTGPAAAPLNLGALDWNGGPTQTMALLAGSVAINAGSPSFAPPPEYDQRGEGYPRVKGGRVDVGAVEGQ